MNDSSEVLNHAKTPDDDITFPEKLSDGYLQLSRRIRLEEWGTCQQARYIETGSA